MKFTHSNIINKEKIAKVLFLACAVFSVIAVFAIIFYILYNSIPAFREIGIFNFIFGSTWAPTKSEIFGVENVFGIFPMIIGTLSVTFGAILIGGTFGVFTAVFVVYYCPKKLKGVFNQIINLLAGIPSIVYGFFGLMIVVPMLSNLSPSGSGKGILACAIILSIMILPTVAGLTKNALKAVPQTYYEGALALGATKEQAIFKVLVKSAKSGILSALILGVGRAIGETMAIIMVAGNNPLFPDGLFSNIRTLTINIAMEMGYATGLHRSALVATGFVLLVFVLIVNVSVGIIKKDRKDTNRKRTLKTDGSLQKIEYVKSGLICQILKYVSIAVAVIVALILLSLIAYILIMGLPNISWNLLFGKSTVDNMTLLPAFVTTGMMILLTLAIALPIGIGSAIYLVEYSKKGSKLVKFIRVFVDTLSGIPSIIFGLFGYIFFCLALNFGYSILAGSLTMVLIILPTIIRSTEESLLSVSDSLREGSLALGAGKLRTIFKIVIPGALSGIITSIILSVGRIIGESAALIYTSGAVSSMPKGYLSAGSTFAVMLWLFAGEGFYINNAYATASVLLIITALLNLLVSLAENKLKGEKKCKTKKQKTA